MPEPRHLDDLCASARVAQGLTGIPLQSQAYNDNLTPSMAAPAPWTSPGGPIILHLLPPHTPHLLLSPGTLPKAVPAHPLAQLPALRASQEGPWNQGGSCEGPRQKQRVQLPNQLCLASNACALDKVSTSGPQSPDL